MIQVGDKTAEELLEEFAEQQGHNTLLGEQYTAAILVKSAQKVDSAIRELKATIDMVDEHSSQFSKRLVFLNWVLTIATVVGAIATAILAYRAFYGMG